MLMEFGESYMRYPCNHETRSIEVVLEKLMELDVEQLVGRFGGSRFAGGRLENDAIGYLKDHRMSIKAQR